MLCIVLINKIAKQLFKLIKKKKLYSVSVNKDKIYCILFVFCFIRFWLVTALFAFKLNGKIRCFFYVMQSNHRVELKKSERYKLYK